MVKQPEDVEVKAKSPAPATKKGGKKTLKDKDGASVERDKFLFLITCIKRLEKGKFNFQKIVEDLNKGIENEEEHVKGPATRMKLKRMLEPYGMSLKDFSHEEPHNEGEEGSSTLSIPAKKGRRLRANKRRKTDNDNNELEDHQSSEEKDEEKAEEAEAKEEKEEKEAQDDEDGQDEKDEKEETDENSGDVEMENPN